MLMLKIPYVWNYYSMNCIRVFFFSSKKKCNFLHSIHVVVNLIFRNPLLLFKCSMVLHLGMHHGVTREKYTISTCGLEQIFF